MSTNFCFAKRNNVPVYSKEPVKKLGKPSNTLMLGTYMEILQEGAVYYKIKAFEKEYWIDKNETTKINDSLKLFFVDVGQGDGMLIEVGDLKIIVDGGKGKSLKSFLDKWKYKYLLEDNKKIEIDHLFITHLDEDHFEGLNDILNDPNYVFKNVYFAGLIKFPKGKTFNLGNTIVYQKETFVTSVIPDIESIAQTQGASTLILKFTNAYLSAKSRNSSLNSQRLSADNGTLINQKINGIDFKIDILGPVLSEVNSEICFKWLKDASKTINGHSLILKITYGARTILLGGDLNEEFQNHIISSNKDLDCFSSEVYKCGHHGSRDFSVDFLNLIKPIATVISSGDNESYDHPSALALGCAGKYSRSSKPLVFSTELARSYTGKKFIYGLIFYRTNGTEAYFSQMKEKKGSGNPFAVYEL